MAFGLGCESGELEVEVAVAVVVVSGSVGNSWGGV